jgi:alkylation response protein AidB-like acyl-CoA dehydrogenase
MTTFDTAELDLIRSSLRHVLDTAAPGDVPAALLAQGWAELVATDPGAAITTLAEQAGRARSAAPIADLAMLWGAASGDPASTAVVVAGHALAGAERARSYLVVDADGITSVGAESVTLGPAGGFDPALGLVSVHVRDDRRVVVGDAQAAARALAAGRRALASQMVGAIEQMLSDTLGYITERHQYGRAIGSFQTVKHRMADVKVAVSAAQAATAAAWESAETANGPLLAVSCKALAGRAQQLASTHCFQVHGGIAFTVEHGFHQWVRRGLLLDLLLGDHRTLTREVGRMIIAAGSPPRLPPLEKETAP